MIAHTKSRQEKSLVTDLASGGVGAYLPAVPELRTHGNRKRWVEMPLFTGYVFVRGGPDVGGTVRRTGRVASVIEVIDQGQLTHELRQIHHAIASGARLTATPMLAAGVAARVARGPLRGLEGVVESIDSAERLVLIVHTLGRATAVEVNPGDVEPL